MATPEPNPYRKLNYPIVNLAQSFTDAEKIQGRANLGIPTSLNQSNKVLTVEDATGTLGWEDAGSGLPGSTSADEGKVLTVDSNGDPQWEEPSGGTITDVQVDGVSVVTDGVAEITMPTVPTKTSELQNDSGFITSADLPTVNDGTLTIQKNGATVDTFTANSSSNKTVDITVPTKTSDLTNDSGFITSAALPTVNDGTLTIQKNGSTVDTFTANSSTNKTVNITVPTNTSDLTNDSGFITSGDIPAQVQSSWTENDNTDPAYIQNKPTTTPIVAGANITISDTQNGVVVSADLSSKEDAFDVGTGLEMDTSGAAPTLQVEAPVDIVAGPGIVIDNPDGNTLRVSLREDYEELLYAASTTAGTTLSVNDYITLSESLTHFEKVKIYYALQQSWGGSVSHEIYKVSGDQRIVLEQLWFREQSGYNNYWQTITFSKYSDANLTITLVDGSQRPLLQNSWGSTGLTLTVFKVVGINRIANN